MVQVSCNIVCSAATVWPASCEQGFTCLIPLSVNIVFGYALSWYVLQVKNVTGRLLVGLRWWNEGNSETGNAWRFESLAEV
jgi:hypothetical protein